MINDTSERVPGASRVSWDLPDLSRTPFLTGLSRPDPLQVNGPPKWAYRHPRTTGVREQASDDLSELYKVSRGTFQWSQMFPGKSSGHIHGEQRSQRSPNTSRHSGNTEKAPVPSP
ncbi:hypothetical protein CDL15_Pgr015119 [Punica granatum]|uniref:Uncharacterized protein n=1 Tax=Punica granatum TaxID=22663 RepID=A0A218WMW1_PUNGR|nr:hypothetical protein CDL15_Pgr015119 [Punica granatum]